MSPDLNIYGIFFPALGVIAFACFFVNFFLRKLLTATGFYRLVWHRSLFDAAMYVCLVGVATIFFDRISQ